MNKHTAGPWYLDSCDWPLIINPASESDNRVLARIELPEGSNGTDEAGNEAVANAQLMVSAPDLLMALERTTRALELAFSSKPLRDMAETLAEAKAVIARATKKTN